MAVLATIANYEAITGTTVAVGADTTRVTALLVLASDAVLACAAGQAIASATYTAEKVKSYEGIGYFIQRPVTAVASVSLAGVALTVDTDYRWTSGGNGRPSMLIKRVGGFDSYWLDSAVLLATYTAGWSPVPGQIIAIVVALTRAMVTYGADRQPLSDTAGPFTTTWGDAVQPGLAISPDDRQTIAILCGARPPGYVTVRPG